MELEQDNQRLQRNIKSLLARIEENQKIQQRFHDVELQLLACTRLAELLDELLVRTRSRFDLNTISLVIYDPDYSTRDLLDYLGISDYDSRLQLRHRPDFFTELYHHKPGIHSPEVVLGPVDALAAGSLFPGVVGIASAALLPLERQSDLIGSLHLGSPSVQRFSVDKATDFMVHLALIVAVCLENCIGREHLRRQGQMDMLTQVSNRRNFEEEFTKELDRAERSEESLTCMFVDVDHFKQVNDTYGHQAGDLCLKGVAQRIQQQLRKTDLLARYGGEEFVVLLPRCHPREGIQIAERVRASIEASIVSVEKIDGCDAQEIEITASIGVSSWQPHYERTPDLPLLGKQLLKAADSAMYDAKAGGRNLVCIRDFSQ